MAEGGQILAMAASGSQDLSLAAGLMQKARAAWRQRRGEDPGETPTLHLQPLYDGTMHADASCQYVLPDRHLASTRRRPACVIGGLTRVREKDDCHRIMDWIADGPPGGHRHPDHLPLARGRPAHPGAGAPRIAPAS